MEAGRSEVGEGKTASEGMGCAEERGEARRSEVRRGEGRRETAQDTFVRTERTVRNGTVHRATCVVYVCVCVLYTLKEKTEEERKGDETRGEREKERESQVEICPAYGCNDPGDLCPVRAPAWPRSIPPSPTSRRDDDAHQPTTGQSSSRSPF